MSGIKRNYIKNDCHIIHIQEGRMEVYIDGSCINNGSANAKAGYGVYFGVDDARNEYDVVVGKQTNNTGELTAFIRALEILEEELARGIVIHIHTDSEYVMKCMKSYCEKLSKNDWKTSNDKIPPNRELLKKAYGLYKPYEKLIKLYHVKAHTDGEDKHSVGNREADRLANLAVGCIAGKCPYVKHYVNVDYDSKDAIKELGAKWDIKEKKWYYTDELSDDNKRAINLIELACTTNKELVPIIEEKQDDVKVYLKIPFKNKDAAKKLGARWDAAVKSWYYMSSLSAPKIDKLKQLEQ
jgi:ribonuclease HI